MIPSDPLRTTELLALIEEASAPLRHDVRNRLASVRNLAFFVRRKLAAETEVERDPRVHEFLLKIDDEVERSDALIEAWSAKLQGRREVEPNAFSVLDSVRLAVDSRRQPTSVAVAAPVESLCVEGDLQALAFAIRCLLENAAEAQSWSVVQVCVEPVDGQCRIRVVDRGPGISDAARSLERFATTKPGHLGLGLCMAQRVAVQHGGTLSISSSEAGAEVCLTLPLARTHTSAGE